MEEQLSILLVSTAAPINASIISAKFLSDVEGMILGIPK